MLTVPGGLLAGTDTVLTTMLAVAAAAADPELTQAATAELLVI